MLAMFKVQSFMVAKATLEVDAYERIYDDLIIMMTNYANPL